MAQGIVTPFDPDRLKSHTTGTARCVKCQHEWAATVLSEKRNDFFGCPNGCGEYGRFFGAYVPNRKQYFFQCISCKNELFYYLEDGRLLCPGCGTYHSPA